MLCSMLGKLRNGYIGGTCKAPYPLLYASGSRESLLYTIFDAEV